MKFNKISTPLLPVFLSVIMMGSVHADFNDGWDAYTNGDFKTASKEWKPLAEKGDAKAQSNLGILYFNGKGVLKDYSQAVKWLKLAAEQNEPEAQYILGKIYAEGDGVIKSFKNAKHWTKLAYENNFNGAKVIWDEYELWKY